MQKLVVIVILNWNRYADTAECLISCRRLSYPKFRIVVVDNGSTDGSEDKLKKAFPEVFVLQTGENLGFAGGNNVGIRWAHDNRADFVWLLNNDTIVHADCLTNMVRAAESDPRAGMVGSKIYYVHAPTTLWYAGGKVDLERGGVTRHIGQNEQDDGRHNKPEDTGYITGCSLLARKDMLEEIGLLEEAYFLYLEDADWSLRARAKGWRLLYEPSARLWHKEGAQTNQAYNTRFVYYLLRNRFFFVHRFAPERMFRCHIEQAKSALFFLKEAFGRSARDGGATMRAVFAAYGDFFIRHKMGFRPGL